MTTMSDDYDDDDDDDDCPNWIKVAYGLEIQLESLVRKTGRCVRISTIRPVKRAVIDRWLWVKRHAPCSDAFSITSPNFDVPEGWRFAFAPGVYFGWQDIAELRRKSFAHLIKIQVLETSEFVGNQKQIAFNPDSAKIVAEFTL